MRSDATFIGVEVDDAVAADAGAGGQAGRGLPGRHLRAGAARRRSSSSRTTSTSACSAACASTPRRRAAVRVLKLYEDGAVLA